LTTTPRREAEATGGEPLNLAQIVRDARVRLLAGLVPIVVAFMSPSAAASDERPGPEGFFQNETMVAVKLSPDGKTLAVLSAPTAKDRVRLITLDVKSMKAAVLAQFDHDDVDDVHWINNHRLVYELDDHQAAAGDRNKAWGSGLWAVNVDGSRPRQLIARNATNFVQSSSHIELLPWMTGYVGAVAPGHDSDDIYVAEPALFDYSGVGDYKLKRVDTVTGRIKDISTPPGASLNGWIFDAEGNPRVSVVYRGAREQVMLRDTSTGEWSAIADVDAFVGGDGFTPVALAGDDQLFVTANRGQDTKSIYKYDLKTRSLAAKPFLQSDRYDLYPGFVTQDGRLLGIRYTIDASVTQWMDPAMTALQAKIDEMLSSTINQISVPTGSGDAQVAVVASHSDRVPGLFYLYDQQRGKLVQLGSAHPEVDPDRMSGMEPVHYTARDGMTIPAWLTVPQGAQRTKLPLVVLVHGGPYMRGESWRWNPEVQFLAARGYAVLEPEFRGSKGYGDKLFKAGFKQWGLGMQNDLADGVKWAVDQGLVDPQRVCIAGASYGGYAVLMGLINDPQIYRCGIEWEGPTDIDLIYTATWGDASDTYKTYGMPRLIGDRVADAAQLKATSPILNAGKIHAPLLMAYGGEDFRVPLEHGKKMRAALAKQSSPDVEWVVYDEEGHGWRALSTKVDFWNRAASFLDKNIGQH
jgi:dipeptidyl aminopeptidase/acylaminoacyl peptidase